MLLGVVEMGALGYSYAAMQMAANTAARRIAVNTLPPSNISSVTNAYLPGWARSSVAVSVTQSNAADPMTNVISVRLTGSSQHLTVLPILTRMLPWAMTADATTKQELPYVD